MEGGPSRKRARRAAHRHHRSAGEICNPTGNPLEVNPQHTDSAGCSERLNGKQNGLCCVPPGGQGVQAAKGSTDIVGVST